MYKRQGLGGVLVYNGFSNNGGSQNVYYAFDAACPYEASSNVKVEVQDGTFAVCPKCGSKYAILNGCLLYTSRCKRLIVGTAGYTVNQQTAIKAALGRRDQLQQHARGARCQKTQFGELNKRSPVGFR